MPSVPRRGFHNVQSTDGGCMASLSVRRLLPSDDRSGACTW